MIKISLLAVVLLGLLVIGGCAKGGNGIVPTVMLNPSTNNSAIYPNQQVTFTAVTTTPANAPVTWVLGPAATCTGTPNPCGQIVSTTPPTSTTAATLTYQAPPCQPPPATVCLSGVQPTITATINGSSPPASGSLNLGLVDVTTEVAPSTLNVGSGLSQQFTAVAVPDYAPQNMFTWTCSTVVNGQVTGPCASFSPAPNVVSSGLASYTANDSCAPSCSVQVSAITQIDPAGCTPNPTYCAAATVTLVASRVNGTYAFQFSGYDSSNKPVAVTGTFTASSNGTISSGVEYELNAGGRSSHSISGGSYTPTANSNNAGTLTLDLPAGVHPNQYQVVLDGNGDLALLESDNDGTGSGIAQVASNPKDFSGTQTYAFGFAGVDSKGNRVGYAGLLPMNGSGTIASGQMDVNDNGNSTNICGTGPCSVAGSYSGSGGVYQMTLTAGTDAAPMIFDFFIGPGKNNKTNPLTFYVITDPADTTNPAVSGTMVLQDSSLTVKGCSQTPCYNNAAFDATSVSALTGVNGSSTNVALVVGSTDGNGDFGGQYDQNDAGTVLSAIQFPGSSTAYTYAAAATNNGRYTFPMLGNPGASPVVPPVPFILYASGANAGFLLDQSSSSVMTGTMSLQGDLGIELSGSELPGTYAAATTASASPTVSPIAANLFATWAQPSSGSGSCTSECLTGTQYPGQQTMTGTYTVSADGTGTIALTAPSSETYVIYVVNTTGCKASAKNANPVCAIQSFYVMGSCTIVPPATSCTSGPWPPSSILYAQE